MLQDILLTKLYVPRLQPGIIHRPRLVELLNRGAQNKLTLVSAAAGFGKTTLISEWVASSALPVVWISLDEEHNDLSRFLVYLIAAIQTRFPAVGSGATELLSSSPYEPQTEPVLTVLLNDIAGHIQDLMIVLDDYHAIENDVVNKATAFLLENMPPQMHLLISTRKTPPLPLARFRARGQLVELSTRDLRFSFTESVDFFRHCAKGVLSSEQVEILNSRAEGWVAGLQLAAHTFKKRENIAELIENFNGANQYVLDYLMEEVLAGQPPHVRRFLEKTAILDRMCTPLCDAVAAEPQISSQSILQTLEQSNLFIVPLDDERIWFRYHHLFRDLLRKRLRQTGTDADGDDPAAHLHMNACAWYGKNGFVADAFFHAVAAKNYTVGADIAEKVWPEMDRGLQYSTFRTFMEMLPAEEIEHHPLLCLGFAWSLLFTGDHRNADRWLKATENHIGGETGAGHPVPPLPDEIMWQRGLRSGVLFARAYLAMSTGNGPDALRLVRTAMEFCVDPGRRALMTLYTGFALWTNGDLREAFQNLDLAIVDFEKTGNRLLALSLLPTKGYIIELLGELNRAKTFYLEAVENMPGRERSSSQVAMLLVKSAVVHFEQGDWPAAKRLFAASEELGAKTGSASWLYLWNIAQAQVLEAMNDIDGAIKRLNTAQKYHVRTPAPEIFPLPAQIARLWIKQGRFAEVERWIKNRMLGVDDEIYYLREYEHITLVRYLVARYRSSGDTSCIADADRLLAPLLEAAREGGRLPAEVELLILQALSCEARNRSSDALALLEQALAAAAPQHFMRVFVNEGEPLIKLLSIMKARGSTPVVVDELLAFSAECRGTRQADAEAASSSSVREGGLLSDRELEVLRLVEKGYSNARISEKLFIALSTVKGHNMKIFSKLNVRNRTEALVRARELNLL